MNTAYNGRTNVVFAEYESTNALRSYPFAETANLADATGESLAPDIFVDACLYPVVTGNPEEVEPAVAGLYMAERYVEISWPGSPGAIGGTEENGIVELYDKAGRHAGTLICGPGWERERLAGRTRTFEGARFAASVCWTIPYAGVTSLYDAEAPERKTTRRDIVLQGDDCIVPRLERRDDGTGVLSFDIQAPQDGETVVRQLRVVATGATPFAIAGVDRPGSIEDKAFAFADIEWYLDGEPAAISREDICWNAHREEDAVVVVDTCKESKPVHRISTRTKQLSLNLCPDRVGAVDIITPDTNTDKNAVRTEVVSGRMEPVFPDLENANSMQDLLAEGQKAGQGKLTGNGLRFSIPGIG